MSSMRIIGQVRCVWAPVLSLTLYIGLPGCSGEVSSSAQNPESARLDGVGSTLGGCPAAEPTPQTSCAIKGRLCTWTRGCATEAN